MPGVPWTGTGTRRAPCGVVSATRRRGSGHGDMTGAEQVMDCLAEGGRVSAALEFAETFHKTPALVAYRVRCGRPNCRCVTGEGHGPYWFLRWREDGVQRRRYVRRADVEAVRAVIQGRQRHERGERRALAEARAELRRLRTWLKELDAGRWP